MSSQRFYPNLSFLQNLVPVLILWLEAKFRLYLAGVGTSSMKWKKYGIIIDIKLTLSKGGKIDIVIQKEFSKMDHSVQIAGYPAVRKKRFHLIYKSNMVT
jgi:hypothetical protein